MHLKSVIYRRVTFLSGHLSCIKLNSPEILLKPSLCCCWWHLNDFCIGAKFETLNPPQSAGRECVDFRFSNPAQHSLPLPIFSWNFAEFEKKYNSMNDGKEKISNFWLIRLLWKSLKLMMGGKTILNSLWCRRNWKLETSHNFPENENYPWKLNWGDIEKKTYRYVCPT